MENHTIQSILDNYLDKQRKSEKRDNSKWHISDMGHCLLKRFWKRKGIEGTPLEPRTMRVFEVGRVIHKFIQDMLKKEGVLVEAEGEVNKGDLLGHYDAIVQYGDKKVLYDFKTVHSNKFHYLKKGERDRHYILQVLTYLMLLQEKYSDLKEARILYISKDDMCLDELTYVLTDDYKREIESEIKRLDDYWKKDIGPPANPPEKWSCRYCQYEARCLKNKLKK